MNQIVPAAHIIIATHSSNFRQRQIKKLTIDLDEKITYLL